MLPRRRFLCLAGSAAALLTAARVARAQTFPSRPVRIIVPTAAGGPNDILTRLIGQWLSERLGQPFIVENRPGAGTNTATEMVVRAPPTAIRISRRGQRPPSTRPSTTSSVSISSATPHRSRASCGYPMSWWCIRHFRQRRFPSSSPTPRPIPESSAWRRAASAAGPIWPASCSR